MLQSLLDLVVVVDSGVQGPSTIPAILHYLFDVNRKVLDLLTPLFQFVFVPLRSGGRAELEATGASLLVDHIHRQKVEAFG